MLADYERLHEHADIVDALRLQTIRSTDFRSLFPQPVDVGDARPARRGRRVGCRVVKVAFHPDVLKQLQCLPRETFETALQRIIGLAHDPHPNGAKKLIGAHDDWRIRFGQYRIVYEIDDAEQTIIIFTVAKRSDTYR